MTTTPRAPGLMMPKKRRVRREKLELAYLRDLVGTMEDKLTLLNSKRLNQLNYDWRDVRITVDCRSPHNNAATWMDCAAEQLKGRAIAVEKNQKLRYSIKGHIELAAKLKNTLHKMVAERGLLLESANLSLHSHLQPYLKFWDFSSDAEEDIFADQLAGVARLRLKLQQQEYQDSYKTINFSWGLSRGNMTVKSNPSLNDGVSIEMHCSTNVPFKLDVTAKAYWRFFCVEHGEVPLGDNVADLSTKTIARSFSLRLEFEGLKSEVSGKYTCQSFVTDDEVMIAWVESADVSEFGGIKFNGLQYQKRACMKLRRVPSDTPGQPSTSTVVETYYETIPVFHGSVDNKLQQTQVFINSAHRSHSKLDKLVSQHMSHLLLEEDWKATFGEACMFASK